ncbi:hypothetical protein JT359_05635 [Candidatus Poribacteria bacterium]|nr:hypothetical protein [Candidatus Poribacteria bacterium]
MKLYSKFITLAGSILTIFSFSMPWLKEYNRNMTGIKLTHIDEDYSYYADFAFILTLVIIFISLHIMARKKPLRIWFKLLVLTICLVGFYCCLAILAGSGMEERFYHQLDNDVGFGVFLTVIGYILVSAGVLSSYKFEHENSE